MLFLPVLFDKNTCAVDIYLKNGPVDYSILYVKCPDCEKYRTRITN